MLLLMERVTDLPEQMSSIDQQLEQQEETLVTKNRNGGPTEVETKNRRSSHYVVDLEQPPDGEAMDDSHTSVKNSITRSRRT